jgi:SPP1 family predicted phage head-tail adaptor
MKQLLELQGVSTTSDGMGGTDHSWSKIDDVWGNIEPVTGSERWEIESIKGVISHVISIRHRAVTNENRFVYNGRVFLIRYALNEGEESHFTKLACSEEV